MCNKGAVSQEPSKEFVERLPCRMAPPGWAFQRTDRKRATTQEPFKQKSKTTVLFPCLSFVRSSAFVVAPRWPSRSVPSSVGLVVRGFAFGALTQELAFHVERTRGPHLLAGIPVSAYQASDARVSGHPPRVPGPQCLEYAPQAVRQQRSHSQVFSCPGSLADLVRWRVLTS